jgi:hypothetical protein
MACINENDFPSFAQVIDHFKTRNEDWYNDVVMMVYDDENRGRWEGKKISMKKAEEISIRTHFKETYDYLIKDIRRVIAGESLFRIISVTFPEEFLRVLEDDPNPDLGNHWTTSLGRARHLKTLIGNNKRYIIMEIRILDPSCIDFMESFSLRSYYPDENEIYLSFCEVLLLKIHLPNGNNWKVKKKYRIY